MESSHNQRHRARMRQAGYRDSLIWLPQELHEAIVREVAEGRYPNRSAAITAAVSLMLKKEKASTHSN